MVYKEARTESRTNAAEFVQRIVARLRRGRMARRVRGRNHGVTDARVYTG